MYVIFKAFFRRRQYHLCKILLVMKLTVVLLIASMLHVSATGLAQKVSIKSRNTPLKTVLKVLRTQTGFDFLFSSEDIQKARPVTLDFNNAPIEKVLETCFENQPLQYTINGTTILITKRIEIQKAAPIKGKVVDDKGEPIAGVGVKIKGLSGGVMTQADGSFTIQTASEDAVLVFSYVGYVTQEVSVKGKSNLSIVLKEDLEDLQEVVVVGYGTQKKANLTGAVSTVDFSEVGNVPQANTVNILSGRIPGVSVVQGGGQPGDDEGDVNIRGIGTLNDSSPLVIIDGVQSTLTDLGNLSANEIANVSVLKDASSAAIYGSRGANGVILVTTKMPDKERVNINFGAYTAAQRATFLPKMVESWQFMTLMNEAVEGTRYTDALIDSAKNGLFTDDLANTKWFDHLFRTAPMQNYDLSVSGKTKGTTFQMSGNILQQDGIMIATSSNRYNLRGNVKTQVNKNITLGLNLWGYNRLTFQPFNSPDKQIADALQVPIMPVRYANGDYAVWNKNITGVKVVGNPILNSEIGHNNTDATKINASPSLRITLLKGLTLNTSFTYSNEKLKGEGFNPTYSYNNHKGEPSFVNEISSLTNSMAETKQIQWQSTVSYKKTFQKKHDFSSLLGHEILDYSKSVFSARGDGLPSNELPVLNNASANFVVKGNKQEWSLQSFFGRASYAYNNKYLAEANLRADGSSRFNGEYRYSPSGSIGWVISKEPFMKSLEPWVSIMKLRAGYGKLGNDRIGNYTFQQVLDLSGYYTVGGVVQTAAGILNFGNPNITWEQTTTTNLGLDLGLLQNRLNINFDIYDRLTDGILFQLPLPLSFGKATSPYQNIAQVSNKGFELAIDHRNTIRDFTYRVSLNFSYNKNRVEELNGQRVIIGAGTAGLSLLEEGKSINSWFGYVSDGLYTQADIDNNYPKLHEAVVLGSIKFKDLNGDGKINDLDRQVIGDGATPYTFGLSGGLGYKGFDLSFLAQGIANKDMYVYDYGSRPGNGGQINFWQEWWTRSFHAVRNPTGDWPRIKSQSPEAAASSSFWISNASYIRLKNVEVGYTFKRSFLEKIHIKQFRMYAAGQNLMTFSSVPKNLDPERSNFQKNNRSYPQTGVVSVGINANF